MFTEDQKDLEIIRKGKLTKYFKSFFFSVKQIILYENGPSPDYNFKPKLQPTQAKKKTPVYRLNQKPKRVTSPAIETEQQELASASKRQSYTRPVGHVWRYTTKRQHVLSLPRLDLYRRETPPEQHHLDPRCVGAPDTDVASAATTSQLLCLASFRRISSSRDLIRQGQNHNHQKPLDNQSINSPEHTGIYGLQATLTAKAFTSNDFFPGEHQSPAQDLIRIIRPHTGDKLLLTNSQPATKPQTPRLNPTRKNKKRN